VKCRPKFTAVIKPSAAITAVAAAVLDFREMEREVVGAVPGMKKRFWD
jgi:hypothetical protein